MKSATKIVLAAASVAFTYTVTAVPVNAQTNTTRRQTNGNRPQATTSVRQTNRGTVIRITGPLAQKYPPRNVTVNLDQAPTRQAVQQLFLKAGRDYSLSNDIDGTVTLNLRNKPFETALRLLANNASQPLSITNENGVYFIRPRRTARVRTTTTVAATQPIAPPAPITNYPNGYPNYFPNSIPNPNGYPTPAPGSFFGNGPFGGNFAGNNGFYGGYYNGFVPFYTGGVTFGFPAGANGYYNNGYFNNGYFLNQNQTGPLLPNPGFNNGVSTGANVSNNGTVGSDTGGSAANNASGNILSGINGNP